MQIASLLHWDTFFNNRVFYSIKPMDMHLITPTHKIGQAAKLASIL